MISVFFYLDNQKRFICTLRRFQTFGVDRANLSELYIGFSLRFNEPNNEPSSPHN